MKNEQYFRYLYRLQESGRTNMFGAGEYLQKTFGLKRSEAKEVLLDWMNRHEEIATELKIEI